MPRPSDHVAECTQVLCLKHFLNHPEPASDFIAPPNNLFVSQPGCIFRFRGPRNREFTALEPAHILLIFLRRNEFVMTTSDEVKQIVQKLRNVSCPDEIVQTQITQSFSQIDPEILIIENTKTSAIVLQEFVAVGMKRHRSQT